MNTYKKIEIYLSESTIDQIQKIVNFKHAKDLLFYEDVKGVSVEKFIVGCVRYYLKKIKHIEDLSGIDQLGKPFKIKNRIKEYITIHNISQQELAEMTKISPSNISLILSNKNQPSLDYFFRIWIALECPEIDWLFYRVEEK